jgi:6-phosphogluconolactonase
MTARHLIATFSTLALTSLAVACAAPTTDGETTDSVEAELLAGRAGAVYTMSNESSHNEVLVYRRAADGSLQRAASYDTTGKGSGDGLGSQGAVTLSSDRRWLFAVNAGSNELSTFAVRGEQLYLVDVVATGGMRPVSVTEHAGLVYVLHGGEGASGIAGFRQRRDGSLVPLAGSTMPLSAATTAPAQIAFSPSGRAIVVTEKATNKISEFRVGAGGRTGPAAVHASNGMTPFGFAITGRGQVVVSEAFGGATDASAVSSYQLGYASGLVTVSASVPDTESAACWVVLAKNDRYAYVSNTASNTISAYTLDATGNVALVGTDGRALDTGPGTKPTDLAVSRNDRFLYVVDSGTGEIGAARIEGDGTLTPLPSVSGLPATVTGLAAL